MSELRVFQSLWATEQRIPGQPERPIAERFDRVRDAGFAGLSIDLGAITLDQAAEIVPHYQRTGLGGLVTAFPQSIEGIRPAILLAKAINAPFVIVVGQVTPISVAGMIPVVRAWLAIAAEEGMPLQFETHRDSITNDLFSTLQLIDAIPELRFSADLSHYVVDREFELPLRDEARGWISRVLDRADSLQGRVATGQHIQVPIDFPQHKPWLDQFTAWWTEGFASWRRRHEASEDVVFLCELGPTEYAITGRDGLELSDRWEEAQALKRIAEQCWAQTAG